MSVSSLVNKPERFKDIVESKDLRWTPDFGTWPKDVPEKCGLNVKDTTIYAGFLDDSRGVTIDGFSLKFVNNGDYAKFECLDFTEIPTSFEARCASEGLGGQIEVRLDSINGQLISKTKVSKTTAWDDFQSFSSEITDFNVAGIYDVFFVFKGDGGEDDLLFKPESFQFKY